jgi:hypothetical protein
MTGAGRGGVGRRYAAVGVPIRPGVTAVGGEDVPFG